MEPKWLELARAELGTKESPGSKNNPVVVQYYADSGNAGIRDDSVAWCAAFCGAMLKRAGLPNTGSLAARSYLNYGIALDDPKPGCIVVFTRGNSSWEGHVGFYIGETANHIKVLGGNQSDSVSIASYPKSKLLGYRWPVEPTAAALKEAGSSEIAEADVVRKVALTTVGSAATLKGGDSVGAIDQLKEIGDGAGIIKHAMEGLHAVAKFAVANLWVVAVVGGIAIYLIYGKRIQQRIARHLAGHPIMGGGK